MTSLLALDFDGVICDGLSEYFQTAWQAAQACDSTWPDRPSAAIEAEFRQLRPVIERGWEMPVLLQALRQAVTADSILKDWPQQRDRVLAGWGVSASDLGHAVDTVRDRWIERDRSSWLQLHQFYSGVLERLETLTSPWVIISTKEGRFIAELLEQAAIARSPEAIYGKEVGVSKTKTLIKLQANFDQIAFVEDRLPALEAAAHLESVDLYLADWGYNTPRDRQQAMTSDRIQLLSLADFSSGRSPAFTTTLVQA